MLRAELDASELMLRLSGGGRSPQGAVPPRELAVNRDTAAGGVRGNLRTASAGTRGARALGGLSGSPLPKSCFSLPPHDAGGGDDVATAVGCARGEPMRWVVTSRCSPTPSTSTST